MKERLKSFKYAFNGIRLFFQSETNAKIHFAAALLSIAFGVFFEINTSEWCFVVLAIALVFSAEAMNTAIEYLTNLVSPDFNELAGKTKDVAAGAVFLAAIGAAIIGGIIFVPKVLSYLDF